MKIIIKLLIPMIILGIQTANAGCPYGMCGPHWCCSGHTDEKDKFLSLKNQSDEEIKYSRSPSAKKQKVVLVLDTSDQDLNYEPIEGSNM